MATAGRIRPFSAYPWSRDLKLRKKENQQELQSRLHGLRCLRVWVQHGASALRCVWACPPLANLSEVNAHRQLQDRPVLSCYTLVQSLREALLCPAKNMSPKGARVCARACCGKWHLMMILFIFLIVFITQCERDFDGLRGSLSDWESLNVSLSPWCLFDAVS